MTDDAAAIGSDLTGRRILVVDDDRINQRILAGILQAAGFVVTPAVSGEEALEACGVNPPDLVLLDVMLPGLDGFATCRELSRRLGEDGPPVVFITALTQSEDVMKGFAAGGVDYLPKPFRANEVLARIRLHLSHRLLTQRQKHLVDELSIANASKNKILGMAAHDLRNPLASIRALAEFLEDSATGPLNPEQRDLVATIREAADGMLGLVTKLVDPAVLELGEVKLELQETSLEELLTKEVGLQTSPAARKGIRIQLQPGLPTISLRLDAAKIQQVVAHVLRNAVRFSPLQGVITVGLEKQSKAWAIVIRDQGPGRPEIHQRKLAQGFAQPGLPQPSSRKSSGVGLAICRRIVQAHGGSLTAENLTGTGCTVRITLPSA